MGLEIKEGVSVDPASPDLPDLERRQRGVDRVSEEDERVDIRGIPLRQGRGGSIGSGGGTVPRGARRRGSF